MISIRVWLWPKLSRNPVSIRPGRAMSAPSAYCRSCLRPRPIRWRTSPIFSVSTPMSAPGCATSVGCPAPSLTRPKSHRSTRPSRLRRLRCGTGRRAAGAVLGRGNGPSFGRAARNIEVAIQEAVIRERVIYVRNIFKYYVSYQQYYLLTAQSGEVVVVRHFRSAMCASQQPSMASNLSKMQFAR